MVGLRTLMALVDVSLLEASVFCQHIVRTQGPLEVSSSVSSLIGSNQSFHVLWPSHSFKICACLPSCFIPSEILLLYFYGKKKGDGRSVFCNCFKTE